LCGVAELPDSALVPGSGGSQDHGVAVRGLLERDVELAALGSAERGYGSVDPHPVAPDGREEETDMNSPSATTTGGIDTDRLMTLWATPPDDDAAVLAGLRALYTDPVGINGTSMTALDLLARIRAMQRAYTGLQHELVDRVDAPGRLVIAFRLRGTHTGPLATPFGELAATGRAFEVRVIDILTLTEGRISEVTMVADELGQLAALGALTLS
jgi:ketosteroid isomerase-like protein